MIIHCSQKLTAKLSDVSKSPLEETSPLGSWHGHLLTIDRRQCVMFCHDSSRYILFLCGLRKKHFTRLEDHFRKLFLATLEPLGCTIAQISKTSLALGPIQFDKATDRSVQSTLRVAQQDLGMWLMRVENVMELDPVAVSCRLNDRPVTIYGKTLWPDKAMLEILVGLE